MLTTTDRDVRDFVADKAAELALATKSDRVYISCYCMMFGSMRASDYNIGSHSAEWTVSVGNMEHSYQGKSFEDACAKYRADCSPESKLRRAEKLRIEAAALELEARAAVVAA